MRLFIAEKPELAKAIADGLGGGKKGKGYWTCGKDYVTWCFGHMLQLLDPEDYDPKYKKWDMDHLPISHIPWRLKPDPEKEDQLNQILALLEKADSVVHAGDPDPEGQLLVDEILDYVDCKLPVQRLLINDNNLNVVKKALNSMRDNEEFRGLSQSALARSVGDQLYGYNLTRAYTLAASKVGYQGVLSVGRVQTTVLGMVVRRTRAFGEHEKAFYYKVIGQFEVEGISFPAGYQVAPEDPVDEKGRLSDGLHAEELATLIKGKPARLVSANTLQKEK
ncbi:DNA topoisomerase, partial [Escherichia coli]|nr:type IA DNA topoisomerase [Escherichia coli]